MIKFIGGLIVVILILLAIYGVLNWLGMWDMAWDSIKGAFRMAGC